MLIRISDHFHNNPKRIDKLIAVKGLPSEWFFKEGPNGREIKRPWEPDVDANIPQEIRHLCEPMYVTQRFSPVEKGAGEILDRRQILGVKIDYNSEPGRDMWERVERYIEETMPRNERVPVPVVCAKDERSLFETYEARRNSRGSLELRPSPVPEVDLTLYQTKVVEVAPLPSGVLSSPQPATPPVNTTPPPQTDLFKCPNCDYSHKSMQGIRMHQVKRHPKKEKVTA